MTSLRILFAFAVLTVREARSCARDLLAYPPGMWDRVYALHVACWKADVYTLVHRRTP